MRLAWLAVSRLPNCPSRSADAFRTLGERQGSSSTGCHDCVRGAAPCRRDHRVGAPSQERRSEVRALS